MNREALGASSRSICKRFPMACGVWALVPVTFPPGRARLATNPVRTGSGAAAKTIGIVRVAPTTAWVYNGPGRHNHVHRQSHQLSDHGWNLLRRLRQAYLDRDVLALRVPQLAQAYAECLRAQGCRRSAWRQVPDRGTFVPSAGCGLSWERHNSTAREQIKAREDQASPREMASL